MAKRMREYHIADLFISFTRTVFCVPNIYAQKGASSVSAMRQPKLHLSKYCLTVDVTVF